MCLCIILYVAIKCTREPTWKANAIALLLLGNALHSQVCLRRSWHYYYVQELRSRNALLAAPWPLFTLLEYESSINVSRAMRFTASCINIWYSTILCVSLRMADDWWPTATGKICKTYACIWRRTRHIHKERLLLYAPSIHKIYYIVCPKVVGKYLPLNMIKSQHPLMKQTLMRKRVHPPLHSFIRSMRICRLRVCAHFPNKTPPSWLIFRTMPVCFGWRRWAFSWRWFAEA